MRQRSLWVVVCMLVVAGGCTNKEFVDNLESRRDWAISERTMSTYPTIVVKDSAGTTTLQSLNVATSPAGAGILNRAAPRLLTSRVSAAAIMPPLTRTDGTSRPIVFADGPNTLMTTRPPGQAQALADTQLFRDVMKACDGAIRGGTMTSAAAVSARSGDSLSPRNVYDFARTALGTLDVAGGYGAAVEDDAALEKLEALADANALSQVTVPFDLVAQAYVKAYFNGKFVNRRGVKLAKPKIEGGKVDNATIAALETVLLEAYFDHRFGTDAPVPYKDEQKYVPKYLPFPADPFYISGFELKAVPQYLTDDNAEPTATKFVGVRKLIVPPEWQGPTPSPDPAPEGLSEDEYEVVRMLAEVNGEVKKQITALVFRIFGGVEFSLVFGGHFSIGNNETLATLVTTLIEVGAARSMEFKWTDFFRQFRYHLRKTTGGKTVPYLTDKDYAENQRLLQIDRTWQDGVLLLVRYHSLLAKIVGN